MLLLMPLRYWVDSHNGIVRSEGSGRLTVRDLLDYFTATRADPAVDPAMHRLMDLRAVTELPTSAEIRQLAALSRTKAPDTPARMAIVASSDLAFGVSMMFKAFVGFGDRLLIVRDEKEALDWLIAGRPQAE
jgi:hypothetical protein